MVGCRMSRSSRRVGCLVTGVAGFVGSHLAERLLSENYSVVGVDNFFSGHRQNLASLLGHPDFFFYERSIVEPDLLADLKTQHPGLESCFHLAAIVSVSYSVEHPETTMEVNHLATLHLLREAERLDFKAFVFAGSAAEYGDDQRLPLREEYATEKTRHLSAYGRSKYLASKEVASSPCGIALRFFNIYGPRQDPSSPYSGVITRFVSMALSRKPLTVFGDGLQTRDFVYVSDVVEAYLSASHLCKNRSETGERLYNVATGRVTSILELTEIINNLTANQVKPAFCPERPGDIRLSAGSVDAFIGATEWRPRISLREGLRNTIEWAREVSKSQ
jgi:UDP-glucose 4-epimerase